MEFVGANFLITCRNVFRNVMLPTRVASRTSSRMRRRKILK